MDSIKNLSPISPIVEDALGRVTDAEATELLGRLREIRQRKHIEEATERSSGLFQETVQTLAGAD